MNVGQVMSNIEVRFTLPIVKIDGYMIGRTALRVYVFFLRPLFFLLCLRALS